MSWNQKVAGVQTNATKPLVAPGTRHTDAPQPQMMGQSIHTNWMNQPPPRQQASLLRQSQLS